MLSVGKGSCRSSTKQPSMSVMHYELHSTLTLFIPMSRNCGDFHFKNRHWFFPVFSIFLFVILHDWTNYKADQGITLIPQQLWYGASLRRSRLPSYPNSQSLGFLMVAQIVILQWEDKKNQLMKHLDGNGIMQNITYCYCYIPFGIWSWDNLFFHD